MPANRALQPESGPPVVPLLAIGPFGGLDPTTSEYHVKDGDLVDIENFLSNRNYAGLTTTQGRAAALAANLPGPCTGIGKLQAQGAADIYIFYVTVANVGYLYWSFFGGTATQLATPVGLTGGQKAFFAQSKQWLFFTNGADRPLKIAYGTAPAQPIVTYWGITAPTAGGMTATASGAGNLAGKYYYCVTFGTDTQESSQGSVIGPVTCSPATAQPNTTFDVSGAPNAGDYFQLQLTTATQTYYVLSDPATTGETLSALWTNFQQKIGQQLPTLIYAFQEAGATGHLRMFIGLNQAGTAGNSVQATLTASNNAGGAVGVTVNTGTITYSGGTAGQSVSLVGIPTSTDSQVTQRNIYRIGGTLGTWQLVTTINNNSGTSTTDNIADANMTGQILVVHRDPPPAFTAICEHMERIVGFGAVGIPSQPITTDLSQVWYSNYNEPWGFNSVTGTLEAGANSQGDVAVSCQSIGSQLILNKTLRKYVMVGQTDANFQVFKLFDIGTIGPFASAQGYGIQFWLSKQGFYSYDGFNRTNLSDGRTKQSNIKAALDALTTTDLSSAAVGIGDRIILLSLPTVGKTYVYDLRTGEWRRLGMAASCFFSDQEGSVSLLGVNSSTSTEIDQWFAAETDLNNSITAYATTRTSDADLVPTTKGARYVEVVAPIQSGASCIVTVTPDPGNATVSPWSQSVDLSKGPPRHQLEVPMNVTGNQFQLTVTVISTNKTMIDRVVLYGFPIRSFIEESE